MKVESIRKRLQSKYATVDVEDLIELIDDCTPYSGCRVLYFKVVIDEGDSVTIHESLESES